MSVAERQTALAVSDELDRVMREHMSDRMKNACANLEGCDPAALEVAVRTEWRAGMTPRDLTRALIRAAVEKTSVTEPNWQYAAARLLLDDVYREAAQNRGTAACDPVHGGNGDFHALIAHLESRGRYGRYMRERYSPQEIEELGRYIRPERDSLFHYAGLKQLLDRYVIRGEQDEILELPQELFMGVAMHLAAREANKVERAQELYDVLSKLEATVATPTLGGARRPVAQLSSCFIDMPEDDLVSIYETDKAFARVSKEGGGMGIYVGKIRAGGAAIRDHKGASGGVVPWIRLYNNTAISCNQLGMRSGAAAIYLDIWHKDILDFLQLRTNNGDDRLKAHDIFPGVCVPDLFMRRVESRETWHLFCPHEIETVMGFRLEDAWGEEFERRYQACVGQPDLMRIEIPAIELMKRVMQSSFETGTPFLFFRDTANRLNPNKHAGMVYASNLCTEIVQNMSPLRMTQESRDGGAILVRYDPGDFVVCNLASLNLARCGSRQDLARVIPALIRGMDNVIDLNDYPVKQAEITSKKYRAVGLGVSGYHQYLAQRQIAWESGEHLEQADRLFEWIEFFAVRASMELAKEKGPYPLFEGSDWQTGAYFDLRGHRTREDGPDWDRLREDVHVHGIRNGYLLAIAPTSSTSLIAGTTAGIDPVFSRYFLEEKKNGVVPQTAPGLNPDTFWYYKEAHTIDQRWSIRAAAVRQRHLDQSQSFNLFITPDIPVRDFLDLFLEAWRSGLKTVYYVRSRALEVEDCVACSS